MRNLQFWVLLTGSFIVCGLYFEQIYLSRAMYQQQRILIESQQIVSMGASYEASWKQLASRIYQLSGQDEALADILKRNQITVQSNKPGATNPTPAQAAPAPAPAPAATKAKAATGQ